MVCFKPFPNITKEEQKPFISKSNLMLKLTDELQQIKLDFIDELALEKVPKKLQNFEELDFKQFIKELSKAKKIKFKEQLEERDFKKVWKSIFNEDREITLDLKAKIEKTDKELDIMVYKLYKLSDDEVRIIEKR
jgi:hypothetical protein